MTVNIEIKIIRLCGLRPSPEETMSTEAQAILL